MRNKSRFFIAILVIASLLGGALNTPQITSAQAAAKLTISGVPQSVTPAVIAGVNNDQKCNDKLKVGCFMLGSAGVLGVLTQSEADANKSAVLIGPDSQVKIVTPTASILLPEGGYQMSSWAGGIFAANKIGVTETAEPNTVWLNVVRGLQPGQNDEDNNVIAQYTPTTPGAALVSVFAVPPAAGDFFSADYAVQNAIAAHSFKNCGATKGCKRVLLVLLDINNGAWAEYEHLRGVDWKLLATNVAGESSMTSTNDVDRVNNATKAKLTANKKNAKKK